MSPIHRSLQIAVRARDASQGRYTFTITSPTVDSYNESVDPAGCDSSQIGRNMPLVDSHNYATIQNQLGTVERVSKSGNTLTADVCLAIDVPENVGARFAAGMIEAGYLRACSIGFKLTGILRPSNGADYDAALERLGIEDERPEVIYTQWKLLELSLCCVGANDDALLAAQRAGKLSAKDIQIVRRARSSVTAPVTQTSSTRTPMSRSSFAEKFESLTAPTRRAFENVEKVRGHGDVSEITRAVKAAFAAQERERRSSYGDPVKRMLDANPEQRLLWAGLCRLAHGYNARPEEVEVIRELVPAMKDLTPSTAFGGVLPPLPVSPVIFEAMALYGAYKDLGVEFAASSTTKYPSITAPPTAIFVTQPNQGTTFPADSTVSGLSELALSATIVVLWNISREWLQDVSADLGAAVLSMTVIGLAARLDYGCFSGNGNNDQANGGIIGLFLDNNIKTVNAAEHGTSVASLGTDDFLNVIGTVNSAALQRGCRWYINPVFIPALLGIRDGIDNRIMLKTPAETGDEWYLFGHPVTWAAQAPSVNAASAPVAMFGEPSAYLVALKQSFELMTADFVAPPQFNRYVRAIMRGMAETRAASFFARMTLAAE